MGVCLVRKIIFTSMRHLSGIEIGIRQVKILCAYVVQQSAIIVQRVIHACDVNVLCLARWDFEVQRFEGTYFGHEPQEERQCASAKSRLSISLAPLPLVVGA